MRKSTSQCGFTLIELLTIILIIGILAALGLVDIHVFRQKAYDKVAESLRHNAEVAIEAGKITGDQRNEHFLHIMAWSGMNGALGVMPSRDYLPGLVLKQNERIMVRYDSACESASGWCAPDQPCCISTMITAYHCKSSTIKSWQRWNNGDVTEFEWANGGC